MSEPRASPPLVSAFCDAWLRVGDFSTRTTRLSAGNFLFVNVLLAALVGIMLAAFTAAASDLIAIALSIAIWIPVFALTARRLNDAGYSRLWAFVTVLAFAAVLAFALFGLNIEKDLIPGAFWIESKLLDIGLWGAIVALFLPPNKAANRFGPNPRYD